VIWQGVTYGRVVTLSTGTVDPGTATPGRVPGERHAKREAIRLSSLTPRQR